MADGIQIGKLRWPVTISRRVQVPSGAASISEAPADAIHVHADIIAVGPQTFLGSAQTDRPMTHWIRLRWLDWIDQTHVIERRTRRRDGTVRVETFRIRRVKEIDGRKRFIECEAELEMRD